MSSRRIVSMLCLLGAVAPVLAADPAADEALTANVAALDTQLFDAFNHCDLKVLGDLVSDDLEFYHDKDGLSRGREAFLAAVKHNICGKVRRELVPGSLQVYPLNHYGALEIGTHMFCAAREPRCDPAKSGVAQFIHVWRQDGDLWRLSRVISYDHLSDRQHSAVTSHDQP